MTRSSGKLPIDEVLPEILSAFERHSTLVVEAPPGAGKTTRIPQVLLESPALGSREIVVTEPRRIAARLAAGRVAEELGEPLGERVGYNVRFEQRQGPKTRLRFVTEGILVRRLLARGDLARLGCVILDEFHERHVATDQCLLMLQHLRKQHRHLKLVIMSATLDGNKLASHLKDCALIRSQGRSFPVTIQHQTRVDDRPLEKRVVSAVRESLAAESSGDVLVFLPGMAEIRKTESQLSGLAHSENCDVLPLHGELPLDAQRRAVLPGPRRKVVLATNVAESSVTVVGISAVVDCGLARVAHHSPWTGRPSLALKEISQASAIQRAGRAGRTRAGIVQRLYTEQSFRSRAAFDKPEIQRSELAETWLLLRGLGIDTNADLRWLDPPESQAIEAAERLLTRLGAIDAQGEISELGSRLLRLPVHPRLGRLVLEGARLDILEDTCLAAALLAERDLRQGDAETPPPGFSDLQLRMDLYRELEDGGFRPQLARTMGLDGRRARLIGKSARALQRTAAELHAGTQAPPPAESADSTTSESKAERTLRRALLSAFSDRLARRQGKNELILRNGTTARLDERSCVRDAPFLLAIDVEERSWNGRRVNTARVVSAVEPEWVFEDLSEELELSDELVWNPDKQRVELLSKIRAGSVVMEESQSLAAPSLEAGRVLFKAARAQIVGLFSKDNDPSELLQRLATLAAFDPDLAEELGKFELSKLLARACAHRTTLEELRSVHWETELSSLLSPQQMNQLRNWTPEYVSLPHGRRLRVHYEVGREPWVESRLQDFFGMSQGPTICEGKLALTLHLLAPNHRAVQVTRDLAGFWERHYPSIRSALARRYPRHSWPENGSSAVPAGPRPRRK